MPLEDTKLVEDVAGRGAEDTVNKYLALGWKILMIYAEDRGDPGAPSAIPHYILGWQDAGREPAFPECVVKGRLEIDDFGKSLERP